MSDDPWSHHPVLAALPAPFRTVRYVGARFPGSAAVRARPGIGAGTNCQLFAYAVLARFGLVVPPVRSSELWADTDVTVRVAAPQPLDLMLVNATDAPWGAHVGVWLGDDRVLHLCAELGRPAVWSPADFAARDRYRTLVGFVRVRPPVRAAPTPGPPGPTPPRPTGDRPG